MVASVMTALIPKPGSFASVDLLIGETTCDGKKKAWEILAQEKDVYVMETPQCKSREQARELFKNELKALIEFLEKKFNRTLSPENLKASMEKIQKKRDLLAKVYDTRKSDPVPISGKDALLVSQVAFYDDPDRQIEMVGKLAEELEKRVKDGVAAIPKGAGSVFYGL